MVMIVKLSNDISQSTNRINGRERDAIVLVEKVTRSLVNGHPLNARVCGIHGGAIRRHVGGWRKRTQSIEYGFLEIGLCEVTFDSHQACNAKAERMASHAQQVNTSLLCIAVVQGG
jgi:hypothetical protein